MADPHVNTQTTSAARNTTERDAPVQKSFSCVLCAQRKVKCDRLPRGCENCTKARVPCIYKAPPPPRRRKKGIRDVDVNTRLQLYEEKLRELGVDPERVARQEGPTRLAHTKSSAANDFIDSSMLPPGDDRPPESGVLVSEHGRSRYLQNSIWTSLSSEFREPGDLLDDSSEEDCSSSPGVGPAGSTSAQTPDLLLGFQPSSIGLQSLHPDPVQVFRLWQAYLDNINPLVKVFHAPTVQKLISSASSGLDDIPRDFEALLFAIYCITIESLNEQQCLDMLGETKSVARQRFRSGARHSLVKAGYLRTSNIVVLQALTLFIVRLRTCG